jgi:hypothetical protein
MKFPKIFRADMLQVVEKVWGLPGVETPIAPDEPDVRDGGDEVGGVAGGNGDGLQRVFVLERSSRSVLAAKV